MEFPLFVYRCPGQHLGPSGTTYTTDLVENEAELRAALAQGWHASLADAADAVLEIEKGADEKVSDDDEPPTRDEMLAMADKLGIKVDKRWSDETLHIKIDAALAESSTDSVG